MVDGIASPQRSRSRPNVISVTSGCDANDKGNRRAKVMPGLSAGFSYWSRNASVGSQCRCPYMGSRFWAVGGSSNSAAPRAGGPQLDQPL
jgi:hypothetical protein